jgi:hypothetical protein
LSDITQKHILKKLLLRTQNRSRLWAALTALCIGTALLLASVMIWWDFNELLYGKTQNDSLASTYLVIGKEVTNENMGASGATLFTPAEIDSVKHAPEVQDVGPVTSNRFPAYVHTGGKLAFATDLPLGAVPDQFLDKLPERWNWAPGSSDVPVILSSQFLIIYNYMFAPSQGLPQLSESSVKSVGLILEIGEDNNKEVYTAHIVGFSDRIGSVLAPQSFIEYGNRKYGRQGTGEAISQLIIKAKDPSNVQFVAFLKRHDYVTNPQNLVWSKMRAIVEVEASAAGVLALLLMGISTLVFILFIELTVARARQSLTLLLQIGYGPGYISRFMTARFLPMVLGTVACSMVLALGVQLAAIKQAKSQGLTLALLPGWPVWAALGIATVILVALVRRSISSAIRKQ